MDTSVARPAIDGSYPVQFRPICLCHPIGEARSSFLAPFCRRSPLAGRHYSRRSRISKLEKCFLPHSHLPRRRGTLSPEQAIKVTVHGNVLSIECNRRGLWIWRERLVQSPGRAQGIQTLKSFRGKLNAPTLAVMVGWRLQSLSIRLHRFFDGGLLKLDGPNFQLFSYFGDDSLSAQLVTPFRQSP